MLFHGLAQAAPARARVVLLASIAALLVTTFEAHAAPVAPSSSAPAGLQQPSPDDEFGARKRYRARRGNSAAGLAMMGMMAGTIGAVIASQQRRDAYRRGYYRSYYDEPYGYYGYGHSRVYRQPYAYHAPRAYHGAPVYRQPRGVYANPTWHDRLQRVDPQNPNAANPTGVPRIGW